MTLLELAAATVLITGTLAPSLQVVRSALQISREGTQRRLVANYATSVLESQCAAVMRSWTTGSAAGNFSADGYASVRYSVTRSDAVASGGLVNQLMHIQVTVFYDTDGDTTWDAGEIKVVYRTKVAKLFSYQNAST